MKKRVTELPTWQFEIDEVSAGVYEVVGKDDLGHRVFAQGTDPDSLLAQCRSDAARLTPTSQTDSGNQAGPRKREGMGR
jgi:hypothetical protein